MNVGRFALAFLIFPLCTALGCGTQEEKTEEEKAAEAGRILARAFIDELANQAAESMDREEAEEAGRALARGFVEELQRLAAESFTGKLRSNMHRVQLALEDFSTMAEGAYPAERSQMVRDVLAAMGYPRVPAAFASIDSLLPSDFRNPFSEDLPALCVAKKDPPDWSAGFVGQVIWVPTGVTAPRHDSLGSVAEGYKLYGGSSSKLLSLVLSSGR